MAGNMALIPTRDQPWFNGFGNMFSKANHEWWGNWSWLIKVAIWMVLINGILAGGVLLSPNSPDAQRLRQEMSKMKEAKVLATVADKGLMIYFLMSGLAAGAGVAILAQDALIAEKRSGTAAWVFTKPVSRAAFLLAKLAADAIGILVTMVAVQAAVGYLIFKAGIGVSFPIPSYLAAVGMVAMVLFFYLSLTYMLGTVSNTRGLVVGVPLLLIFGYQFGNMVPVLVKIMPWNLVIDMLDSPALAIALVKGQPLATVTPIIGTALMTVLFTVIAVWRIQREEF